MSRLPVALVYVLALAAAAAIAYWRLALHGVLDEVNLDRCFRITLGQIPYRDFYCPTTPLMYYAVGAWLKAFGCNFRTLTAYSAVQTALFVGLTLFYCRLLRLGMARGAVLAVLALIWAAPMMLGGICYDGEATFWAMLGGIFFFFAGTRPGRAALWALLCGAACALAFWTKQDIGGGAIAGGALGFFFLARFRGRAERRGVLIAYIAGLFLVSAAVCLYFGAHGVFSDMMYWIVKRGFMLKYGNAAPTLGATLNKFISPLTTPVDHSTKFVLLVYFAAGLLSWRRFRAGGEAEDLALFGVALLWFFALYASVVTHNGQGYTVMVSNLACILGMLWRHWAVPLPSDAPKGRRVPAWIFATFVGAVGARGVKYVHNPGIWTHPRFALQSPRLRGMYAEKEEELAYDWMIGYIGRSAAPGEAFFTFDYYAAYFATGRPSPLRVTEYRDLAADEDSILQDISKPRVRWFLNRGGVEGLRKNITLIGMDRVKGYIENNFRLMEQRAGYSVWVRTDPL